MPQVSDKDVIAIKDWLAKEPYLPKDIGTNELIIKKFIFSCHGSLERTKRCIEDFCKGRAVANEVYTDRKPMSTKMQTAFSITCIASYIADVDEILIHKVTDAEKFEFYDLCKSLSLHIDNWIRYEREVMPENQILIMDIKEYTLSMVAKCNIFFLQKFLVYLLESMPLRLKAIHIINCPSFYEYMYGLVKGVLPQEIRDMMHFHADHMSLHKTIDKKYLPLEYDGEAESMYEQSAMWMKRICEDRTYLNEDLWKADLSKKPKNEAVNNTMSGSFRTLAID